MLLHLKARENNTTFNNMFLLQTHFYVSRVFENSFCEMTWLLTQNKARNIFHHGILSNDKGYVD